jgi:hypothetical protein
MMMMWKAAEREEALWMKGIGTGQEVVQTAIGMDETVVDETDMDEMKAADTDVIAVVIGMGAKAAATGIGETAARKGMDETTAMTGMDDPATRIHHTAELVAEEEVG